MEQSNSEKDNCAYKKFLEEGNTNTVLNQPKNKYTKSLLHSSLN